MSAPWRSSFVRAVCALGMNVDYVPRFIQPCPLVTRVDLNHPHLLKRTQFATHRLLTALASGH